MKTLKFNDCPIGEDQIKWDEHVKWMTEIISSYNGKRDKEERIDRLIERFPEYATVIEVDFQQETINYAHNMIKVCADFLAGNVRNEQWFNEYVSELNYRLSQDFNNKISHSVTPPTDEAI